MFEKLKPHAYACKEIDAIRIEFPWLKFVYIKIAPVETKLLKTSRYDIPVIKDIIHTQVKNHVSVFLQ
jgi:hypothetical protein